MPAHLIGDHGLLVSILSTGFPRSFAEKLAWEVVGEAESDEDAFATAGLHLKIAGDDRRLRRQFNERHLAYVQAHAPDNADDILDRAWKAFRHHPDAGEQNAVCWLTVETVVGPEPE